MRTVRVRWLLMAAVLSASVGWAAETRAVETNDPARPLALKVLNPPGLPGMPLQIISAAEPSVVSKLRAAGMSDQDAKDAAEQFIIPEMRKRTAELERLIEDVFIETFTPGELKSIPEREQSPIRNSAAAKFPAVTARATQVANTWMDSVRQEVIARSSDRFRIQSPPPTRTGEPK